MNLLSLSIISSPRNGILVRNLPSSSATLNGIAVHDTTGGIRCTHGNVAACTFCVNERTISGGVEDAVAGVETTFLLGRPRPRCFPGVVSAGGGLNGGICPFGEVNSVTETTGPTIS